MTPDNALSHLFPGEPRQPRTPEAADSPATVELRPVLQRRIAAPASYLLEVIDEPPGQNQLEPSRETKSPPPAGQTPVDLPVKTERIIERIIVEPALELPRRADSDDRAAPARKPDRGAASGETGRSQPEPSRPVDSDDQKTPAFRFAPDSQPRNEPPAPAPFEPPAPVQVQQGSRAEKSTDREPLRARPSQPDTGEPERETVVVQPVIHREPPRAPEPAPKAERADLSPRAEKPEPPATVSDKVAVAPKAGEDGDRKIEPARMREEPKPATALPDQPAATRAEPVFIPVAQPQSNTDSQSSRQPSPGGVTLRIGSIHITSRGKSAQKPPTTRRPARSHKIEPRLPFASGRW